jgi:putative Holliday junction resolvase
MNLLGIDYGTSKVGLALATGPLASPYKVIKYNSIQSLLTQLHAIIELENINKIIVGISENKSGEDQKAFANDLKNCLSSRAKSRDLELVFQDETLTTSDAQTLSREAGIKRIKRKNLEDAFAATLILQSYLDNNP